MGLFAPDATTLHELSLTRLIAAPRGKVFRCWTEPALIVQWFTPPTSWPLWPSRSSSCHRRKGAAHRQAERRLQ
jgi:hypothetical protein